jgi:purine nucleoside permease
MILRHQYIRGELLLSERSNKGPIQGAPKAAGVEDAAMLRPLPIRVVVVTMYEPDFETGGEHFGEFRLWAERLPLPEPLAFPCGFRDLRYNAEKGVLGIVSGVGTARAAASIMALGTDPRFDLTRAYWLVAGIAGVNPREASLGSAAWVEWVVDFDLAFEIDAREIPPDWPTGYLPLGKKRPYEEPPDPDGARWVYRLDPSLVAWAYGLTGDIRLPDTPALQAARVRYVGFPAAQSPPSVLRGDEVAGSTFWHGELLNRHAIRWLAYWTGGRGRFAMAAMEETGTLQALSFLTRAGRADLRRVMVLRTGSNYTMPPPGIDTAESLTEHSLTKHAGYRAAIAAAYTVGRRVVDEITENWSAYTDTIPTPP